MKESAQDVVMDGVGVTRPRRSSSMSLAGESCVLSIEMAEVTEHCEPVRDMAWEMTGVASCGISSNDNPRPPSSLLVLPLVVSFSLYVFVNAAGMSLIFFFRGWAVWRGENRE